MATSKILPYSLPTGVKKAINNLEISNVNKQHANRFVQQLLLRYKVQNKSLDEYVEMYSQAFANTIRWLPPLLKFGIIETDGSYVTSSNGQAKCKGYRINKNLLFNPDTYTLANTLKKIVQPQQSAIQKGFIRSANTIKIPEKMLYSKLDAIIGGINADSFICNSIIPLGTYKTRFLGKHTYGHYPLEWSHKKAEKLGVDLILDGSKVIIGSIDQYVRQKRKDVEFHNRLSIERLLNKDYEPKRNLTNNRLDTVFTNFSKDLFEVVKDYNGLCEIDCKNSQYALLANKMGIEVDAAFYNVATMGKLYESLALAIDSGISFNPFKGTKEQLVAGQKARQKAKLLMMLLVFGKVSTKIEYLDLFKNLYPDAYAWIVDYKENNPEAIEAGSIQSSNDYYKALPISLQLIESQFWIDNVLMKCYDEGIVAISRHDSISFFKEDKDEVVAIIQKAKQNFEYNFTLAL
ncbi:MAG: hypothetical protein AAGL34_13870 [Bacteroidota bacterium]